MSAMPKKQVVKTRKVQKEIRQAVEAIPDLIMEEMAEPLQRSRAGRGGREQDDTMAGVAKKKRILWAGVGIMTAIIGGLWYGNLRAFFATLTPSRGTEAALLSRTADDFRSAIRASEDAYAAQAAKETDAFAAALAVKVHEALAQTPTTTSSTSQ